MGYVTSSTTEYGRNHCRMWLALILPTCGGGHKPERIKSLQTLYSFIPQPANVWSSALLFTTQQEALCWDPCYIDSSCTLGRLLGKHLKSSQVQVIGTGEWAVQLGFKTAPCFNPLPNDPIKSSVSHVEVGRHAYLCEAHSDLDPETLLRLFLWRISVFLMESPTLVSAPLSRWDSENFHLVLINHVVSSRFSKGIATC